MKKFALSKPLKLKYLDANKKFTLYPPFELKSGHKESSPFVQLDKPMNAPPPDPSKPYNPSNFIDVSHTKMFKLPAAFK